MLNAGIRRPHANNNTTTTTRARVGKPHAVRIADERIRENISAVNTIILYAYACDDRGKEFEKQTSTTHATLTDIWSLETRTFAFSLCKRLEIVLRIRAYFTRRTDADSSLRENV